MGNLADTYGTDVDRAIELMNAVAKEMRQDPDFRYMILDDLEVMGLDKFTDAALVLQARLRTPPGKQWSVAREFNRRLKVAFEEHGIDLANPQRTIRVISDAISAGKLPEELAPPPAGSET